MKFILYTADVTGVKANTKYKNKVEVKDTETLKTAVSKDYVFASYKGDSRSEDNFIESDCAAFDIDNDHSDDPLDWISEQEVIDAFPGVGFAIHFSRNHMKDKGEKVARPKFHVIFPIDKISNKDEYKAFKNKVSELFPYVDKNALDAGRFFFGTPDANVKIVEGDINLTTFIKREEAFENLGTNTKIESGARNSTMSQFAARVLKKYGTETNDAYEAFIEKANDCEPPLSEQELETIWHSALKFYKKISSLPNYIPPSKYNDTNSYLPEDFTDVGQAEVLNKYFKDILRYSPATKFLWFNGIYWKESEEGAQRVAQELTRRQLKQSVSMIGIAKDKLAQLGGVDVLVKSSKKDFNSLNDKAQKAVEEYNLAVQYYQFVLKRRDSKYIEATLKQVRNMVEIEPKDLNSNEFLLNTPNGTIDLRKGVSSLRAHNAEDFITKSTAVAAGLKGKDIWLDCINKIFGGDQELIDYVQLMCGVAIIGKVYIEALIVAYGDGGNGKSTFWNAMFRVLGNYSGKISADALTTNCKRNIKPEMAEINGRRLLIASESQEGARLDDSVVKQLSSTDEVQAEKKYKDPFFFTPCHTLVLYTNHLPKVRGADNGIWRRLIVIPFLNKMTGGGDVKNYADYLYENAGEYILTWLIEGAKKAIDAGFKFKTPKVVEDAINDYREQNDWFHHFLEDCCQVGENESESSADLYSAYRRYCEQNNEYTRSTTDFYAALETNGFERYLKNRRKYFKGLTLHFEDDFSDFLD